MDNEYSDLEYLVALAEHRHFRRAADSATLASRRLAGKFVSWKMSWCDVAGADQP